MKNNIESASARMRNSAERIYEEISLELENALRLHPMWPDDPLHALAVVQEEVGEVAKATLTLTYEPGKETRERLRTEALQACATLFRFIHSLDREAYDFVASIEHEQVGL